VEIEAGEVVEVEEINILLDFLFLMKMQPSQQKIFHLLFLLISMEKGVKT